MTEPSYPPPPMVKPSGGGDPEAVTLPTDPAALAALVPRA